jgi:hypothetical protein
VSRSLDSRFGLRFRHSKTFQSQRTNYLTTRIEFDSSELLRGFFVKAHRRGGCVETRRDGDASAPQQSFAAVTTVKNIFDLRREGVLKLHDRQEVH